MKLRRRPSVQPPQPWKIKPPREMVSATGSKLQAFNLPGQHMAAAAIIFDLPLSVEPVDKEGIAGIVYSIVDEGTKTYPGTEYATRLEELGATAGGHIGYWSEIFVMDVPAQNLIEALKVVSGAFLEPLQLDEDINRHKQLRIQSLEQANARSSYRADTAFRAALINPKYRASRPRWGDPDKIATVTGDEVRDFSSRYTHAQAATVVFGGDFAEDPLPLAAKLTESGLQHPYEHPPFEKPEPLPPRCVVVDRPGSVQADVRYGVFGLDYADPDSANLWTATYALGGAFLSRLNSVLREEKGYSYGVRMQNSPGRSGGLLQAAGSFRTEVAVEAIADMRRICDIRERPFTTAEITDAKNYAAGSNPANYQTASQLVDSVANLVGVGLGYEYVNLFNEALTQVTADSATAAYLRLWKEPTLVVVGDASALARPLADDGWPVEVID